jgi:hypothetical protein
MKRLTGLLLCFIIAYTQVISTSAIAQTQSNTSGSNTAITGGYTSSSSNTFQSGSSSNSTTSTSNTTNAYSGDTRVTAPANAPSMSAYSQDLCLVGYSAGVSTFGVGVTGGSYSSDLNCERIKLSKVLNDLGMKVAAVSILCQDPRVFFAMEQSGTPCPFEGKIGNEANAAWLKYEKLRPDYNQYVEKLTVIENARKEEEKKKQESNTPKAN